MNTTTEDKAPQGLETLAQAIENHQAGEAVAAAPEAQAQAQAPTLAPELKAVFSNVAVGIFKAGRGLAAKRLPNLKQHVTDEMLEGPANALMPLVGGYLDRLAPLMNERPELAAFALSLLPVALGVLTAMSEADSKAKAAVLPSAGAPLMDGPVSAPAVAYATPA
jgi:hypothetical protein